jgi:hypothetical protein
MRSRLSPTVLTAGVEEHPAARAWIEATGNHRIPRAIHVLKNPGSRVSRSGVYRLEGVGPGYSAVIAKRSERRGAQVERAVYEDFLPQLTARHLRLLAAQEDADGEFEWLFIEAASGAEFTAGVQEHRWAAADWLVGILAAAPALSGLEALPERGPNHYRKHLDSATRRIERSLGNPALGASDLDTLGQVLTHLSHLESDWAKLETECAAMPDTLVHGDFVAKNMRVLDVGEEWILQVFDWAEAGRGAAAVDLWDVDPDRYGESARHDMNLNAAMIREWKTVGAIFRWLAAIDWESCRLGYGWTERAMRHMRTYETRLSRALDDASWINRS